MHLRNYEETLNDAMQSTKLNDARYLYPMGKMAAQSMLPCSLAYTNLMILL